MTTPDERAMNIHTVTVERLLPGGVGLARVEGRSVLLAGTAPGDVVEVRTEGNRASVLRIVEPSPDRVVPICQDLGPCGGCDLMHLAYPAQLAAKRGILEDCLRRIGKLGVWPDIQLVGSPDEFAYRWRASFHVAGDGSLGYKSRRSNTVVPIRQCHILYPALEAWRAGFDARDIPAGTRVSAMTDGHGISVAAGSPADTLTVPIGQERYLASADGFFQANGSLVEQLVAEVVRMAAVGGTDRVLDLYAGAGLFTMPLARQAASVVAVESDRGATALLRRQVAELTTTSIEIREQRVEHALARRGERIRPDIVVLDPPRAGAGSEVVGRIAELRPSRVVMVSCDPATFARDIKTFVERGYNLRELTLLDMFPQTHHLEVVGLLSQVPGDGGR